MEHALRGDGRRAFRPRYSRRGHLQRVHVINETGLPMVVAGLSDSVVVATPDGILVSGKRESARLKPLVEKAALSRPMYERRHWGEYRVLDSSVHPDGRMSLAKELVVGPGCQAFLSGARSKIRGVDGGFRRGRGRARRRGLLRGRRLGRQDSPRAHARRARFYRAGGSSRFRLGDVLVERI